MSSSRRPSMKSHRILSLMESQVVLLDLHFSLLFLCFASAQACSSAWVWIEDYEEVNDEPLQDLAIAFFGASSLLNQI